MSIQSVLVVDDSEADQFLSKYMIQSVCKDVDVHQAFDGREALSLIEELDIKPDLIFFDINMPIMNGFEFLDIYKDMEYSSPVVMLTSSDHKEDIEKCMSFECVKDYLLKPLSKESFAEFLES